MPLTSAHVVARNRMGKAASSLFPAGMVGTVPESPEFQGGRAPDRSPAVTDPGSVGTIDNEVGNDAPGTIPTTQLHTDASGTDIPNAANGEATPVATLPEMGSDHSAHPDRNTETPKPS